MHKSEAPRERYVERHIVVLGWANSRGKIGDMTPRDVYLMRAAELIAKVDDGELDPALKAEFDALARAYLRLAEQAERNDSTDIIYRTPNKDPEHP